MIPRLFWAVISLFSMLFSIVLNFKCCFTFINCKCTLCHKWRCKDKQVYNINYKKVKIFLKKFHEFYKILNNNGLKLMQKLHWMSIHCLEPSLQQYLSSAVSDFCKFFHFKIIFCKDTKLQCKSSTRMSCIFFQWNFVTFKTHIFAA